MTNLFIVVDEINIAKVDGTKEREIKEKAIPVDNIKCIEPHINDTTIIEFYGGEHILVDHPFMEFMRDLHSFIMRHAQ